MELRKVQETGKGTLFLSLPKAWARHQNLKKGSFIAIRERLDGCLILDPAYEEEGEMQEAIILYPQKTMEYIEWGITGAYLLGYDVISIQGKKRIKPEDRGRIKNAIRSLIGLEILEEHAYGIQVQCLIDSSLLMPARLLRRKNSITISMLIDALTALMESDRHLAEVIVKRDDEVDRLYFLLVRLLRSAIRSPKLAEKFRITPIQCLDYRVAATLMETIGDYAVDVAEDVLGLTPFNFEHKILSSIKNVSETLEEMQNSAVNGFLTMSVKALLEVHQRYDSLLKQLNNFNEEIGKLPSSQITYLSSISSSLEKIARANLDITDLTAPIGLLEKGRDWMRLLRE
ncbi:MAG: PhoU domain-containing protein [Candidatus Geothermarchaeales archaeon]